MKYCFYEPRMVPAISLKEVLRYSGMPYTDDTKLLQKAEDSVRRCSAVVKARCVYRCLTPVLMKQDRIIFEEGLTLHGSLPIQYLSDCDRAVLVLATVGQGVDRYIASRSVLTSVDGLLADATGSAAVEALLDEFCRALSAEKHLKLRISPGYGDFSLENQIEILRFLDAHRNLGVCLNDSLLMSPAKSVSALIGIRKEKHV